MFFGLGICHSIGLLKIITFDYEQQFHGLEYWSNKEIMYVMCNLNKIKQV